MFNGGSIFQLWVNGWWIQDVGCLSGLIRFAGLMFNGLMVEVFSNCGLVDGGYKMLEIR